MRAELVSAAMEMTIAARGGDVAGMVFHHDRGGQGSTCRASSAGSASATASVSPQDAPDRAWTTPSRNRSGQPSSESSSRGTASRRALKHGG
jgi:hypothetical protein